VCITLRSSASATIPHSFGQFDGVYSQLLRCGIEGVVSGGEEAGAGFTLSGCSCDYVGVTCKMPRDCARFPVLATGCTGPGV